jgi:uncharacterized membrane protein YfcA
MILFTMFLMGIVLGFTGTGGSGFIIALLVVVYRIPIHTALGVSLASMIFSTLTGSISHIREGNVHTRWMEKMADKKNLQCLCHSGLALSSQG